MRRAGGATLTELLVVLAIVGVLLAMLLPAVQKAREAARRMSCASRLRQIGAAIQQYELQHGQYPPASIARPGHNLLTFLLPWCEQSTVADRYDWHYRWSHPRNRDAVRCEMPLFRCPSAVHETPYTADYAACLNIVSPARRTLVNSGVIRPRSNWLSTLQRSRSAPALVRDGLSQSMMLWEDAGRPAFYKQNTRMRGQVTGAAWADVESSFEVHHVCRQNSLINCHNNNEIYSFHPQGCQVLFADGSVRWLSQGTDAELFVSMFTRAAGD